MSNHSQTTLLIVLLCALMPFRADAGSQLAGTSLQAIDKILGEYDGANKPALAVTLLQDGKVIYEKALGNADLEHRAAATVDTKFQAGSLAWEFIAAAVLTLEEQGKLTRDDNLTKYLPELPDLGEKISINHLLSSTDGVYGYRVMKMLAGWESKQPERYETILPLLQMQKAPNFTPGKSFSPGGETRFVLLMKIVERISGQSFADFCAQHFFSPLGMHNTLFVSDKSDALKNVAVPYLADSKGVYKATHVAGKADGPIDLYTSVRDLSIWRSSMSSPGRGKQSLSQKLHTPVSLDSGKVIKDISGISMYGQLHAGKERGIPKFYRIGTSGGYASSLFYFPEQNVTAIALSSGLAYNGNYAMRIASVLLKTHFTEPETIDYPAIQGVSVSPDRLRRYAGSYWDPLRAIPADIHVKNGVLYYSRIAGSEGRASIPLSDSAFQLKIDGDDKYSVEFVEKTDGTDMHFIMNDSDPIVFKSYTPVSYSASALAQFAGTFHSRELDSSFDVTVQDGKLIANNIRVGTVVFKPVTADLFSGNRDFMGSIKFNRGKNNLVTGFDIAVDEVRHLEFKKIANGDGS